jgi:hypothetical protein
MKGIALILFTLFLSFAPAHDLAKASSPEQFKIVPVNPQKGLLDVMQRGRCDPSQLIAVMKDNNLSWDDLHHLQPGQPIRLSSQCSTPADPETAVQSTAVVLSESKRTPTLYTKTIQDLQNQIAALKVALANALSVTGKNSEIGTLNQEVKDLQSSNDLLTKRLVNLPLKQKTIFFVIGCLLASLAWGVYVLAFKQQPMVNVQKEYPDEVIYNNYGRIRRARRIAGAPYQCECGESNLQLHAYPRHCIRTHVEDRLEEYETTISDFQPQMV